MRRNRRRFSPALLLPVVALAATGLVVVYSVTRGHAPTGSVTSYVRRQTGFVAAGSVLMGAVTIPDYRGLRRVVPVAFAALTGALGAVLVAGARINGARAWFRLGPAQFEPSEFGKLVLIVALASLLGSPGSSVSARRLLAALAVAGLPMMLIFAEPDLGVVLVYAAVTIAMVFVAGVKTSHLVLLAVVAALGVAGAAHVHAIKPYQLDRLTVFASADKTHTDASFNVDQAMIAVGNGQLTGEGLFRGTQTQHQQVPEQRTDFIFTAVGEELGFVGSAGVVALYAVLAWRIWHVSANAADRTGTLICVGVLAFLVFHVFENVGMATGMMPVTGIPLPLMSYGGSSVITAFIGIGLVLNVHHHTPYPD